MESLISAIAFGTSVAAGYVWGKRRLQQCDSSDDSTNEDKATISTTRHSSSSLSRSSSFHLVRHLSLNSKWSEYSDDEESFIQDFPKIELHVVRVQNIDVDRSVQYHVMKSVSISSFFCVCVPTILKRSIVRL